MQRYFVSNVFSVSSRSAVAKRKFVSSNGGIKGLLCRVSRRGRLPSQKSVVGGGDGRLTKGRG